MHEHKHTHIWRVSTTRPTLFVPAHKVMIILHLTYFSTVFITGESHKNCQGRFFLPQNQKKKITEIMKE